MEPRPARALLHEIFARALAPDRRLAVSEWADRHRVLSGVSASEPGPWRTERTPYLKTIMDALSPHDSCVEVSFQKGTQVGATEAGNNWAGYIMANRGGPVMVVYPTSNTAKRASKTRIAPMIEHCPVLAKRVAKPRARNESNTALMKEFEGGVLVLAGANSGPELRSMPVKYLYLDSRLIAEIGRHLADRARL